MISTFAGERSGWLRRDLDRPRAQGHRRCRSSTSRRRTRNSRGWRPSGSRTPRPTTTVTPSTRRSRTSPRGWMRACSECCSSSLGDHAVRVVFHGLLLHPRRREAIRGRFRRSTSRCSSRRQHGDPGDVELHDALGAAVDQAGNRAGLQAGLVLTFFMGLDVPADPGDRVRARGVRAARRRLRDDLLLPHGAPRSARVRRPHHPARS